MQHATYALCNMDNVHHAPRATYLTAPATRSAALSTDANVLACRMCGIGPTGVDRKHRATASAAAADGAEQPRRSRGECSDRLAGATWRVACRVLHRVCCMTDARCYVTWQVHTQQAGACCMLHGNCRLQAAWQLTRHTVRRSANVMRPTLHRTQPHLPQDLRHGDRDALAFRAQMSATERLRRAHVLINNDGSAAAAKGSTGSAAGAEAMQVGARSASPAAVPLGQQCKRPCGQNSRAGYCKSRVLQPGLIASSK
jgi:hypothetical protein